MITVTIVMLSILLVTDIKHHEMQGGPYKAFFI